MTITFLYVCLGGGKRGHNVADTLLRTQMFPRLPVRATFVADTTFVSETQEMFLIFVRNILYPQQMFPRLRGTDTKQIMFCVPLVCPPKKHHEQQCVRNNVSSFASIFTRANREPETTSSHVSTSSQAKNVFLLLLLLLFL